MITPASHEVSRVSWYSGTPTLCYLDFGYATFTLCGRPFQARSPILSLWLYGSLNPPHPLWTQSLTFTGDGIKLDKVCPRRVRGLGFSLFARHYLGNLLRFIFLCLLRCFSSAGTLHPDSRRGIPDLNFGKISQFGHPRIKACLATPRGLSQPTTSFFGYFSQGIHHIPLHWN